jgi:hypothetical protein
MEDDVYNFNEEENRGKLLSPVCSSSSVTFVPEWSVIEF